MTSVTAMELLKIFVRVGLPKEILGYKFHLQTDEGILQFTMNQELMHLHISPTDRWLV